MPRYRYTATALSGKTLHGVTEAASAEALYSPCGSKSCT